MPLPPAPVPTGGKPLLLSVTPVKVERFGVSTCDTCCEKSVFFPPPHMTYRVRYSIWQVDAATPHEAKKKVCETMKSSPETFITVEALHNNKPFWWRILTGK